MTITIEGTTREKMRYGLVCRMHDQWTPSFPTKAEAYTWARLRGWQHVTVAQGYPYTMWLCPECIREATEVAT